MTKINNNSFITNIDNKISCDNLVVGSGAGGSVAASELTEKGQSCILIEEGDFFNIDQFKGSFSNALTSVWRNAGFTPIIGNPNFAYGEGKCLGGSTFVNGGLIWRTPNKILEQWNNSQEIEGYDFHSLNNHFKKIEKKLNVVIENNQDGLNKDSELIHNLANKKKIKSVYVPRAIKNCKRHNNCASGCSSGAKQSVLQGYIYEASFNGLKILTGSKVIKINFKKNGKDIAHSVLVWKEKENKFFEVFFKRIFLACGPIQTPKLINHSLGKKISINYMQIHLNFRISAIFKDKINSDLGTIFTTQIQEYQENGDIFMSSNFDRANYLSGISKVDNQEIKNLLDKFDYTSTFVLQTKPKSKVKIYNFFGKNILKYNLNIDDFNNIKEKIKIFSKFLFEAGAIKIILPFKKDFFVSSINDLESSINKLKVKDLEMLSVHGMSTCSISKNINYFFDNDGRSRFINNLYAIDASILPSNIGESPQGTIMAFAHEIINRIKL